MEASNDKHEYPPVSLLIHGRENSSWSSFWNLNKFLAPEDLFSSRMYLRKKLLYLERFMKSAILFKICRREKEN